MDFVSILKKPKSNYRAILCLNGDLAAVNCFDTALPIIAADGAANTLVAMGIDPLRVIGDLDSCSEPLQHRLSVLHDPDQNSSDFQKALTYLQQADLLPAIIVGMNGGFIDHILNNINIFMQSAPSAQSIFYAPPILGLILQPGEEILLLPPSTKLSIMGMPAATLSTQGLKWELQDTELTFPGQSSCFNRTVSAEIVFHVQHGRALLMIYLQPQVDAGL